MKRLSFSRVIKILKKSVSVICSLCIVMSVVAVIPFITKADNTDKMFVISPNAEGETKYANVFIPLDFRESGGVKFESTGEKYYYFKLTFKAILFNDKMPIIGIMRSDPYSKTWGSFSEPKRAHNNQNDPNVTQVDTILTTSYDDATSTFTAIVKMFINDKYSDNFTKAHTAITIGNMEHNSGWYSEKNFDAHFAFAYPQLYAYDTATGETYGDNLIAGINDSTVNLGSVYKHNPPTTPAEGYEKGAYSADDHMLGAPANKWSIEATPSLISLQEIPSGYFNHSFTFHPLVVPTVDTDGTVAYYTCECDLCKGKYFSDRGITEIPADQLVISKNPADGMLLIGSNGEQSITNIFAPIDLNDSGVMTSGAKNVYVKVTFKARMLKGTQPIIGRVSAYKSGTIRGSKSSTNTAYNNQIAENNLVSGVYSEYDPDTMTFTAVIRVRYGAANQTLDNGVHEVITIGNAEHNGSGYSENDFNVSFYMSQPQCYVLDADGNAIGNNVFPPLNQYTFDSENVYKHASTSASSAYTDADSLVFAEKGRWSIDTTAKYISIHNIPEDYFTAGVHNFIEHPAKEATVTEQGNKLYYTCDCEHCNGKYFSDQGLTEVAKDHVTITKKMIIVSPNSSGGTKIANAFIPLNFRSSGGVKFNENNYYFKLTFKLKILGNSMPVVGMMRYNPYNNLGSWSEFNNANNNQLDHSDEVLFSEYDPETMIFTAVVKTWINDKYSSSPTGAHTAITIGNAEHNNSWRSEYNFDASFAFSDPKLYAYNAETGATYGENLIADITDATFYSDKVYQHPNNDYAGKDNIMAAPANMWCIDGQKNMITLSDIPKDYFVPSEGIPHMVIFSGRNDNEGKGKEGRIFQKVKLQANKKYQLSYNAKYAGTGIAGDKLGGQLEYYTDGSFKELTAVKTESQNEYKEIFNFTMPSDAASGSNFRFTFNYSSGFTSGYMANFELYEVDAKGNPVGANLFKNGDFSVGGISMWNKQGESYQFIVSEIPENFFSKTNPAKPNMVIYRNTSDYAQLMQMPMLKPNTTYEFSHTALHTDYAADKKPYSIVYEFYYNERGVVENASIPKERIKETTNGAKTTMVFTTLENIRVKGDNNSIFRLYMRSDSAGYWGIVELYELDENGNRVGNNILLNPEFTCGTSAWQQSGDMTIRTVETPADFFESYSKPKEMIYSNGQSANQTYSQSVKVKAGKTYYYSGFYVNMNSVGVNPQIQYLSTNGTYKDLSAEIFYDSDRYFFEIAFNLPEDASINNGQADIRVQMNNLNKGKGYFAGLMLTEEGKYNNLLNDSAYSSSANFEKMEYSSDVFVFYYDDEKFDDGDWSGERANNSFEVKIGTLSGRVVDKNGMPVSGMKMKLMPGNIAVTTDVSGNYTFDNLKPQSYKLYLVENAESSLFCLDIKIQKGISTFLPSIVYDAEGGSTEIEEVLPEYGMLKGFYYTKKGKTIAGAKIYLRNYGDVTTDDSGMFTFENVEPGEYELYTLLDNGEEYVLRTVKIEANKGIQIKVMEPIIKENVKEDNNTWIIIVIVAGSAILLTAAALIVVLIIKKKKVIKIK